MANFILFYYTCLVFFNLRYSSIKKDKGLRTPYTKRRQNEQDLKRVRLLDKQIKQARADRKRSKRLKEEEKRQRKLENERKSEVVIPVWITWH